MPDSIPKNHPISAEKAKELISGPYRDVCLEILKNCCAPIYWVAQVGNSLQIVHNGTITFADTSKKLIGITAAHVFRQYEQDAEKYDIRLFIMNGLIKNLSNLKIDIYEKLDLVTFEFDEKLLKSFEKKIVPISWPPKEPAEGKGIMLGGYPQQAIIRNGPLSSNFGLVYVLDIAKTVSEVQITWRPDPKFQIQNLRTGDLPSNYNFGGISGGPLLSLIEEPSGIVHYKLGGIVVEDLASSSNLVAVPAGIIKESGRITKFKGGF